MVEYDPTGQEGVGIDNEGYYILKGE